MSSRFVAEIETTLAEARHATWLRSKDTASRTPFRDWQRSARQGMARDAVTLMVRRLRGEVSQEDYVAGLRDLDAQYPERSFTTPRDPRGGAVQNWREAADHLEATVARDRARRARHEAAE